MDNSKINEILNRYFVDYENRFIVTGTNKYIYSAGYKTGYKVLFLESRDPEKYPDYILFITVKIDEDEENTDIKIFKNVGGSLKL